ncbi:MAG: SusD/RagB family nutrient-binding outer membrane lipoprotein [Parabacteroides sp.]|nr:SusD/RagB family nutrient-binding outer membrane lipoprotein [Parabacteroides sp.]
MKSKFNKYIAAFFIAGMAGLVACTDDFESQNSKENGFTEELQSYDYMYYTLPITIVEQGIYFNYDWGGGKNWPFQIIQNLEADMFSGYFHDMNGSFNSNNSTYHLADNWTSSNWTYTYGYIMTAAKEAERKNADKPEFLGIAKVLKVELMHRIADIYGPLVYSNYGESTGSEPDDLKTAYYAFFNDLDDALASIRSYTSANPDKNPFQKFDYLTPNKTYGDWIKFANSLRLRLAMRLSSVDPARASEEAKKALLDAGGVLEAPSDVIAVNATTSGYSNPLGEVNKGWGEVFMNASMESFLVGYDDPRLSKYYLPATGGSEGALFDIKGMYKGVRQGTGVTHNKYADHSSSAVAQNTDAILLTAAEVWFLRAEAALRGYISGDAGDLYAKGVETSFAQWGAGDASAYLESTKTPAAYKDAFDAKFDAPATTDVTPKWDNSLSNEQKLEKIITQKWLAIYPEGCEAWTEQRRTGYPKLFKVAVNNSGGEINTDIMIRRLFYPQSLKNDNPTQYEQLTIALGGPDTGGTRLWWDTGRNF